MEEDAITSAVRRDEAKTPLIAPICDSPLEAHGHLSVVAVADCEPRQTVAAASSDVLGTRTIRIRPRHKSGIRHRLELEHLEAPRSVIPADLRAIERARVRPDFCSIHLPGPLDRFKRDMPPAISRKQPALELRVRTACAVPVQPMAVAQEDSKAEISSWLRPQHWRTRETTAFSRKSPPSEANAS